MPESCRETIAASRSSRASFRAALVIEWLRSFDEVVDWVVLAVCDVCRLYQLLVLGQEELRHSRITLVRPFVKILTSSSMYRDNAELLLRAERLLTRVYSFGSMMICLFSSLYI